MRPGTCVIRGVTFRPLIVLTREQRKAPECHGQNRRKSKTGSAADSAQIRDVRHATVSHRRRMRITRSYTSEPTVVNTPTPINMCDELARAIQHKHGAQGSLTSASRRQTLAAGSKLLLLRRADRGHAAVNCPQPAEQARQDFYLRTRAPRRPTPSQPAKSTDRRRSGTAVRTAACGFPGESESRPAFRHFLNRLVFHLEPPLPSSTDRT
jgi:hypothetical protein